MAKKILQYIKKDVRADTEYRELQRHDKKYVMDKLRDIIEIAEGIKDKPEYKDIHWQIIRPNSKLPRRSNGASNSIYSAAAGIISNIEDGTQRDFSNKTCGLITKTTAELSTILLDWDEIAFEETVSFPLIPTTKTPFIRTTYRDMFDVNYEITIRKLT